MRATAMTTANILPAAAAAVQRLLDADELVREMDQGRAFAACSECCCLFCAPRQAV